MLAWELTRLVSKAVKTPPFFPATMGKFHTLNTLKICRKNGQRTGFLQIFPARFPATKSVESTGLRKAHEKYKIIEEPEIQIKKLMKSMNKKMKSLEKEPKSR
jgi:hypothetical protein